VVSDATTWLPDPEAGGPAYQPLLPLGPDETVYRRLDVPAPRTLDLGGRGFLEVPEATLEALAEAAFFDLQHLFRAGHLAQLRDVVLDPESSPADRFVSLELLKNAVIASARVFPSCQDTGTAIVMAKKGQQVLTTGDDREPLSRGIRNAYARYNLRFSQLAPLTMTEEVDTGTNLPAQIEIEAVPGEAFEFLMIAKGGGSANKTFLHQETRRLLDPERLLAWLEETVAAIGTTACPPYHLAIVVGGLSAEQCLKTVKLASTRELDALPEAGTVHGQAFRDRALEARVLAMTRGLGIGAQFGGRHFCHDVRIVRLPRHNGSLPVGIGVSCSADRQIKARISAEGVFLEQLEEDPARFLPEATIDIGAAVAIDLDRPMAAIRADLARLQVGAPVLLSGTLVVARDLVHAALAERLEQGAPLPDYLKDHPIYYAGPARTPAGHASGSFGPTTAARMDAYMPGFQAAGASLVTLAKGNRSPAVVESCKAHGGFYLATIGGAAARLGRDMIKAVEAIDFEGFGMEAAWRIRVEALPAFLVIDDKGNDFYRRVRKQRTRAAAGDVVRPAGHRAG
jgi:fumarate hydratase, class I